MEFKNKNSLNSISEHQEKIMKEHLKDPKYKTELCKNFTKFGKCSYKGKCRYAHGEDELVSKNLCNKNYKKARCDKFHNSPGYCPYGTRCQYIHTDRILSELSLFENNFYQMLLITKFYDPSFFVEMNNLNSNNYYYALYNNTSYKETLNPPSTFDFKKSSQFETSLEKQDFPGKRLSIFKEVSKKYQNSYLANHIDFYSKLNDGLIGCNVSWDFPGFHQEILGKFYNVTKTPKKNYLLNDLNTPISELISNQDVSSGIRKESESTYNNQFNSNFSTSEESWNNKSRSNSKTNSLKKCDLLETENL